MEACINKKLVRWLMNGDKVLYGSRLQLAAQGGAIDPQAAQATDHGKLQQDMEDPAQMESVDICRWKNLWQSSTWTACHR